MNKKLIVFSFLVMCFLSIWNIQKTYSLFESKRDVDVETNLAKWIIKVNEQSLNSTEELIIDTLSWNENEYVKPGKVAPDMNGYFDLVIDPTGTEVSVRYDLIFDFSGLNNENLQVDSIEAVGFTLTKTAENIYTGVIPLTEVSNGTTHTIRVNLSWIHTEENNEQDGALGMMEEDLEIPVNIKISQYLGEEIKEFIEESI